MNNGAVNNPLPVNTKDAEDNGGDTSQALTTTVDPTGLNLGRLNYETIMMIDDDTITMDVVQAFLEDAGYGSFILISDSTNAVEQILEHRPGILLLDLDMPDVTGFEVLQQVRAMPAIAHLPVIILTSSSDAKTKLQALDLGATDFLAKPVDPSELALRVRNTLAAKAYRDQLAYYDALTNLPNNLLFMDQLTASLESRYISQQPMAVLHVVLDDFKRINDTFGPQVGDEVIRQVSDRLVSQIQNRHANTFLNSDTAIDEQIEATVYRVGSEEFAILCPQLNQADQTAIVASRILSAMQDPFRANNTNVYISISIGIASFPYDAADTTTLLQRAVGASAQASAKGGGCFEFYSVELNDRSLKRLQLEAALRQALENEQLFLVYQPKVDIKSGVVESVEALLRWRDKDGNVIPPSEFVPLAEDTGLIIEIGDWVLRESCEQIRRWKNKNIHIKVAVNLSTKQFLAGDLVERVEQVLNETGVDSTMLILELTESLLMADPELAVMSLNRLMALGTKVSIDDFGTGYSSLSYLKRFPLDELKIDRSFIVDVAEEREDQALVSAIVYLAHQFGLTVVAEGVETEAQRAFLERVHCDQFQGFIFSRPVLANDIEILLRQN